MTLTMHAPQIIMLLLWSITLLMSARDHGKIPAPSTRPESIWRTIISLLVINAILLWGGFWTPA